MTLAHLRGLLEQRGGFFYGWIIVFVSFVTLLLVSGLWSAFALFINPIQSEFNMDRASVSLVMSVGLIVMGGSLPFLGKLIDEVGPRKIIIYSSVLMGVSTVLLNYISSFWQLLILYGIPLAIGFAGAGLVSHTSLVRSWFDERSDFALSVMQSGLPFGQLIVVPIAAHLIFEYGWRRAYLILGLLLTLLAPVMVFFLAKEKEKKSSRIDSLGALEGGRGSEVEPEASLLGHVKTPSYLILIVVYFICGFTDIPIATHMGPFITDKGYAGLFSAYVLSIIGGATWIGTLFLGVLSRRFKRRFLIVAIYFVRAAAFFILLGKTNTSSIIVFAILFGLTQFSMVPLIAAWIGDTFGAVYMGRLFGLIALIHALGASSGTFLDGWIHDVTDNYQFAFIAASVLAFLASALYYFMKDREEIITG